MSIPNDVTPPVTWVEVTTAGDLDGNLISPATVVLHVSDDSEPEYTSYLTAYYSTNGSNFTSYQDGKTLQLGTGQHTITTKALDGFNNYSLPVTDTFTVIDDGGGLELPDPGLADYRQTILDSNPSVFLEFDVSSGTVAPDSSGNNRPGRYDAGSAADNLMAITPAQVGSLDGNFALRTSGDTGVIIDDTSWDTSDSFSVELWLQVDQDSPDGYAVLCADPDNMAEDGGVQWQIFVSGSGLSTYVHRAAQLTAPYHRGGVCHVVVVFAQNQGIYLYIDGEQVRSDESPFYQRERLSNKPILLGHRDYNQYFINSVIDNFAFYNRALSAQEVAEHHAAGGGDPYNGGDDGGGIEPPDPTTPVDSQTLPEPGWDDVWGTQLNAAIASLHLGPATHDERPQPDAAPRGAIFVCTTHHLVYKNIGYDWVDFFALPEQ